jgi:hypothetical protein
MKALRVGMCVRHGWPGWALILGPDGKAAARVGRAGGTYRLEPIRGECALRRARNRR